MLQFDSLPTDIWFSIINLLPIKDVFSMERTSKQVHQLVQPAVRQKCIKLLQSPKYHSRQRIKDNFSLVMTLANRNILPNVHQQLWALEAALDSKAVEAIDTIKARFHLIPQMHNICIDKIQTQYNQDIQRMAAEFMQFLDSKGITHQHLDIKGRTVDEIIDMWDPVDYDSSSEFTELAQIGDFQGCQRLLSLGRIRIDLGSCLKSEAISLSMIQFLVEQPGINVNEVGSRCPLVDAGSMGNVDIVKLLLEQPGIDINQRKNSETALSGACRHGRLEIVKLLLERPEIDVNLPNTRGYTAIMRALKYDHMDIVQSLACHPDIDLNLNADRGDGRTLLIMACRANSVEKVDWLLKLPAININMTDHYNCTALHHAASRGRLEVVERLLQHPLISLNEKNKSGNTALMLAAGKGHWNIIALILNHSWIHFDTLDVCKSVKLNEADEDGNTALIHALKNGCKDVVKWLLSHPRIDVNHIDKNGSTALIVAVESGNVETIELLLSQPGINVNHAKNNGYTALMRACQRRIVRAVEFILGHPDIKLNQDNMEHVTAFLDMCSETDRLVISRLLSDMDINQ